MPRRILAKTVQVHDCPVYKQGDQMVFALPELVSEDCDAVCAVAVSDLLPWAIKLTAGGVGPENMLLCRGCRAGKAQAGFGLEVSGETVETPDHTRKLVSLRQIPLFAALPERQLGKIEPMIKEVEFAPGEEIITFGEPGRALSILTKGQVDVLRPDDGGQEKLLGVLSPGECFGEMSLLTGDPCNATIRARSGGSRVKALMITKEDFDALLARNPVLNRYFSKLLALRLNRMSKAFTDQTSGAVTGDLHMIGPTELIQAITVTDRSGTLKIEDGRRVLQLLFHQGQIWRLEATGFDDTPEEAFYAFLTWTRGRFGFEPTDEPPKQADRTFFKDTTSLLLEGMRRLDESDVGAR